MYKGYVSGLRRRARGKTAHAAEGTILSHGRGSDRVASAAGAPVVSVSVSLAGKSNRNTVGNRRTANHTRGGRFSVVGPGVIAVDISPVSRVVCAHDYLYTRIRDLYVRVYSAGKSGFRQLLSKAFSDRSAGPARVCACINGDKLTSPPPPPLETVQRFIDDGPRGRRVYIRVRLNARLQRIKTTPGLSLSYGYTVYSVCLLLLLVFFFSFPVPSDYLYTVIYDIAD